MAIDVCFWIFSSVFCHARSCRTLRTDLSTRECPCEHHQNMAIIKHIYSPNLSHISRFNTRYPSSWSLMVFETFAPGCWVSSSLDGIPASSVTPLVGTGMAESLGSHHSQRLHHGCRTWADLGMGMPQGSKKKPPVTRSFRMFMHIWPFAYLSCEAQMVYVTYDILPQCICKCWSMQLVESTLKETAAEIPNCERTGWTCARAAPN